MPLLAFLNLLTETIRRFRLACLLSFLFPCIGLFPFLPIPSPFVSFQVEFIISILLILDLRYLTPPAIDKLTGLVYNPIVEF